MSPTKSAPAESLVRFFDVITALTLVALIQIEIWVFEADSLAFSTQLTATILAPFVALPIAVRRQLPGPALLVNGAAIFALVQFGYPSDFYQWSNLIMLLTIALYGSSSQAWLGLGVSLLGVAFYFQRFPSEGGALAAGFVLALWVAVWLGGRTYQARIGEAGLRADRDVAAELAATRQERLELQTQRTQMARELHDLIGHTVNVMVVHAGAGRRALPDDIDGAKRSFATIEETGRSALDELDRVLGVLRTDDSTASIIALPGVDDLKKLTEHFSNAGLPTSLLILGDRERISAAVGLTIYRIVQEALTNSLKHAAASQAQTRLEIREQTVEINISDNGCGLAENGTASGRGLNGLRERAELHQGSLTFGNGSDGGFAVHCVLSIASSPL